MVKKKSSIGITKKEYCVMLKSCLVNVIITHTHTEKEPSVTACSPLPLWMRHSEYYTRFDQ